MRASPDAMVNPVGSRGYNDCAEVQSRCLTCLRGAAAIAGNNGSFAVVVGAAGAFGGNNGSFADT
ncbi:hypothetical protein [Paenibacillus jilunlii]|uniref:Uncharacterized protein n=1 Tax=Paenibacillus jilunlii TaxID=682956 RepID=A0ABR5SVQ5_9BACL|nr:hypothetical protein [Paenibacillus jilunlii]KWX75419.1 hypothetical protein AML91_13285 [Paenibacillus jilunlii]